MRDFYRRGLKCAAIMEQSIINFLLEQFSLFGLMLPNWLLVVAGVVTILVLASAQTWL